MRLDLYIHDDVPTFEARVLERLDQILTRIVAIEQKEIAMAGELDALIAQAQANADAEQSAVNLLGQLHQLLSDALANNDIGKLKAITAQLGVSKDALAAAIVATTPSGN